MSVSAAPGIAKSSQALVFKKNTNTKSLTAAYNEGTYANPRTTLKTTVGGNVQRSTIVSTLSGTFMVDSGRSLRNVNPALVKPDNSLLRSGLNLNKGYDIAFMKNFASKFGNISNPYAQNTNHMSTLDKIALLTAAGVQIGKAIDAASSKSTDKTTSTNTTDISNNMINSSSKISVAESITNMQNAQTSLELEPAIAKAQERQKALPGEISGAKADLQKAEGETASLEKAKEDALATVTKKEGEIDSKTNQLSELKVSIGALTKDIASKKAELSRLENSPNKDAPGIQINISSLKDEIATKEKMLKEKQAQADKLEVELPKLKAECEKAKNELADKTDLLTENENKKSDLKKKIDNLEAEQKSIGTAIDTQTKRLEKLKASEDNEIKSLGKDITNLDQKIEKKEKSGKSTGDLTSKRQAAQNKLSDLLITQALRRADAQTIGGDQFKEATVDGKQVYSINGKQVTASEYIQKKDKAEIVSGASYTFSNGIQSGISRTKEILAG